MERLNTSSSFASLAPGLRVTKVVFQFLVVNRPDKNLVLVYRPLMNTHTTMIQSGRTGGYKRSAWAASFLRKRGQKRLPRAHSSRADGHEKDHRLRRGRAAPRRRPPAHPHQGGRPVARRRPRVPPRARRRPHAGPLRCAGLRAAPRGRNATRRRQRRGSTRAVVARGLRRSRSACL